MFASCDASVPQRRRLHSLGGGFFLPSATPERASGAVSGELPSLLPFGRGWNDAPSQRRTPLGKLIFLVRGFGTLTACSSFAFFYRSYQWVF
ncbi:hypothetical protein CEXT_503551 [Caerostris extrusa]|uniref:Transmembrane protein n=1 Tax=Caerostris extrusa TaxID=172846 RepID=A0AAV4VRV2_CAEEX|nr:hypothetical protein CEXT_503551 [Caerostris extrusa]